MTDADYYKIMTVFHKKDYGQSPHLCMTNNLQRPMNTNISFCFLVACCLFLSQASHGQEIALKTNLLYDATASFNIGAEIALGRKYTLDVSGNWNPWTFSDNMKWKHWFVQPELRRWFCEKMGGHFVGIHAQGGQYNAGNIDNDLKIAGTDFSKLKDSRCQGWFIGAGAAYGYAWMLSKHLNIEAEMGLGYAYSTYDRFQCPTCGSRLEKGKHHDYFGLTKAAVNIAYIF